MNPILANLNNPQNLEALYREDPEAFKAHLLEALETKKESALLQFWNVRLNYEPFVSEITLPVLRQTEKTIPEKKLFFPMILLAVTGGLLGRILLHGVINNGIQPINLVFLVFLLLHVFFSIKNQPEKKRLLPLTLVFLLTGWYVNTLNVQHGDTTILAYLHLPILWWILTGISFCGDFWRRHDNRLAYVRFSVEFVLLYGGFAFFGVIGTGLTLQLFSMLGMDISAFYFENVVVFGAVAFSVIASYLVLQWNNKAGKLLAQVAKILSPLILITLVVYSMAMIALGSTPFAERDFLLTFNGLLIFVLAVNLFLILEGVWDGKKKFIEIMQAALIAVTLLLDLSALFAIALRLSAYGITANRLTVLGLNLVILFQLSLILTTFLRIRKSKSEEGDLQKSVTRYLPVYGFWSALVVFLFPLLFPY